jgi:hypothetical protein
VNPCPSDGCSYSGFDGINGVVDSWSGGTFATGLGPLGTYVVFGGGHNSYYGNELYGFDLSTRLWRRITEPVVNPSCNQSTGTLQGGGPCSPHSYSYLNYHPATNSFVELASASNHDMGGGGAPRVMMFDFDTGVWSRRASKPTFVSGTGASTAFDPSRGSSGIFWYVGSFGIRFASYDPALDRWSEYSQIAIDIDTQSAIDPVRDLLVVLDARGSNSVLAFDLTQPNAQPVSLTLQGGGPVLNAYAPGFQYHPPSGSFVAWIGGKNVWRLRPPLGAWRTQPWVWEEVTVQGAISPGNRASSGTYNRWQWAPLIDSFVVINSARGQVYAYRPNF